MIWLLAALLTLFALFLDIRAGGEFHHADTTDGRVFVSLGRLRREWRFRLIRTADGHRLVIGDGQGAKTVSPGGMHPQGQTGITQVLRRAAGARRFLLRHLHWDEAGGLLLLRMGSAAHSALLCGAAAGLLACLPAKRRMDIRILPEFFRAHSTVHVRCIIRLKLGILFLTAGMLLPTWLRTRRARKREERAYGTSHR